MTNQIQKGPFQSKIDDDDSSDSDVEIISLGVQKTGPKRKPVKAGDHADSSEAEISDSARTSSEFSLASNARKGRVKRKPSSRPMGGHFVVPNRNILDESFTARSLGSQKKAPSVLRALIEEQKEPTPTSQTRKGRGRTRSVSPGRKENTIVEELSVSSKKKKATNRSKSSSPTRKASNVSTVSEGTTKKKKKNKRSVSASPTRKASNVSTGSEGALATHLKKTTKSISQAPARKESQVSAASEGALSKHLKKRPNSRSQSPPRKGSHVSTSSEGALAKHLKRRTSSRSQSPTRKTSNVSSASDGVLPNPLKKWASSRSLSPARRNSNTSAASHESGSSELWSLPRRKDSIRSSQSLSPVRGRRPLEKVIEENESKGLSTILKKKKKAMARSQSSSPVRKPRAVSKAVKAGELSPLAGVLKKKKKDIATSQSLSPIREARTVSKALKGEEESSSLAAVLRQKKNEILNSKSLSPVRKGSRATVRSLEDDRRISRVRSLSPVRENTVASDEHESASISHMLKRKKEQLRNLSFSPVRKNTGGSQDFKVVAKSHSLSPKTNKAVSEELTLRRKRPSSLTAKGGSVNRNSALEHQSAARIDFTGAVIDMDDKASVHSQVTSASGKHNNEVVDKSKNRKNSLDTINSFEDSDEEEQPASTLSFAVQPPISALSFGDKNHASDQFSLLDTSDLEMTLEDHIRKSRTGGTENSPSDDDNNSEAARPSFRRLKPEQAAKAKSVRAVAPGATNMDVVNAHFPDDSKLQRALRYLYILPPTSDETKQGRRIRVLTWLALICDFLAALVSVTTFRGVSMCCRQAILSTVTTTNWNKIIRIGTYVYMGMIFMEIIPVVRDQIPFNLINPLLGFLITFAVFFDDDVTEAVTMWVIEVLAITCEFLVYLLKRRMFAEKEGKILEAEEEIQGIRGDMRARREKMKRLREGSTSPGTYKARTQRKMENGSYPEVPMTPIGQKSGGSVDRPSRSPLRKVSNSPIRSRMRERSESRSAASSRSPVRTFSNSPKRVSSRSPIRQRSSASISLGLDSLSIGSLSPVRESFHPKRRNVSRSPLRRGSSGSIVQENNSVASSASPSRRPSNRMQRSTSLSPVRRGSSGALSMENRSTSSSQMRSRPSPGGNIRSVPRVGRSPICRQASSSDTMHVSLDGMRVPMGSEDFHDEQGSINSYEEIEAQKRQNKFDDRREMRNMINVRKWKQEQEVALGHLGYLMFGVFFNLCLVIFTMILIVMIAKNEGLCVVDMEAPRIFSSDQLDRCFDCVGKEGVCEVCRDDGTSHCYYPYY